MNLNFITMLLVSIASSNTFDVKDVLDYHNKCNLMPTIQPNDSFKYLAKKYGNNITISVNQLQNLLNNLTHSKYNQNSSTRNVIECFTENFVEEDHDVSIINNDTFHFLCPSLIELLEINSVESKSYSSDDGLADEVPSRSAVWGYGILSVTIISLCSLIGISFLPLMKSVLYDKILLYLVTLAVGTLSSNALFQLIPEGFGVDGDPMTVWRSAVIFGGFYLFYLTENILERIFTTSHYHGNEEDVEPVGKTISTSFESNSKKINLEYASNDGDVVIPVSTVAKFDACQIDERKLSPNSSGVVSDTSETTTLSPRISQEVTKNIENCEEAIAYDLKVNKGKRKQWWIFKNYKSIKTVAWLITIADGMHNFIDGLAIGASFSTSMLRGVSTSIAIFCEEFPHELGDFAILLSSGMSIQQAAFYNFASACCCYLGLIVGILIGHDISTAKWIFALAGGVFLYISLTGMLPEAEAQAGSKKLRKSPWLCLLLKHLGLLTGFLVMFILSYYKDKISLN